MAFSKEDILRRGFVYVKVVVTGLRQNHKLKVVREKTPTGWFTVLEGRYAIPETEMVRLAADLQLPIRSKGVMVFPEGKMQQDFTKPFSEEEKAEQRREEEAEEELGEELVEEESSEEVAEESREDFGKESEEPAEAKPEDDSAEEKAEEKSD